MIREGTGSRGMQLRLVAGPLSDAAAAAKLCAVMSEKDRDCEPAVYDGQRLIVQAGRCGHKAGCAGAARRSTQEERLQKRAALEEPARKPEASWASFFGKQELSGNNRDHNALRIMLEPA